MDTQPMQAEVPAEATKAATLSRDEARAKIFGSKPKSRAHTLFGVPVELREPPMGVVLDAQEEQAEGGRKSQMARMITQFVYLPSGEQLFEEADAEAILELPFGEDFRQLSDAMNSLLGVQPTPADKSKTPE